MMYTLQFASPFLRTLYKSRLKNSRRSLSVLAVVRALSVRAVLSVLETTLPSSHFFGVCPGRKLAFGGTRRCFRFRSFLFASRAAILVNTWSGVRKGFEYPPVGENVGLWYVSTPRRVLNWFHAALACFGVDGGARRAEGSATGLPLRCGESFSWPNSDAANPVSPLAFALWCSTCTRLCAFDKFRVVICSTLFCSSCTAIFRPLLASSSVYFLLVMTR